MQGTRTRVVIVGAVERTPTRTRGVLFVAWEEDHEDERQLSLPGVLEAGEGDRAGLRSAA